MEEVKHIVAFYRNFRLYSLDYTILHGKDVFAPGLSCATPPVLHSFLKVMRVVDESDLVDKDRLVKVMDLAPAIVTPSLATLICSLAPSQKVRRAALGASFLTHANWSGCSSRHGRGGGRGGGGGNAFALNQGYSACKK